LTAPPLGHDVRSLGGLLERNQGMTRDNRIGAKVPPDSEKPNVDNRARQTAGAKAPPVKAAWLKPLGSYDRKQQSEFQVTRFG
jgi:hypothetical protein